VLDCAADTALTLTYKNQHIVVSALFCIKCCSL